MPWSDNTELFVQELDAAIGLPSGELCALLACVYVYVSTSVLHPIFSGIFCRSTGGLLLGPAQPFGLTSLSGPPKAVLCSTATTVGRKGSTAASIATYQLTACTRRLGPLPRSEPALTSDK
jgi:hypothetical protein